MRNYDPSYGEIFVSKTDFLALFYEKIYHQSLATCLVRNKVISMYKLLELKCQHPDVKLLVQTPNNVKCDYNQHPFENRRIWTDNRYEDCYNDDIISNLLEWQSGINFEICSSMADIAFTKSQFYGLISKVLVEKIYN